VLVNPASSSSSSSSSAAAKAKTYAAAAKKSAASAASSAAAAKSAAVGGPRGYDCAPYGTLRTVGEDAKTGAAHWQVCFSGVWLTAPDGPRKWADDGSPYVPTGSKCPLSPWSFTPSDPQMHAAPAVGRSGSKWYCVSGAYTQTEPPPKPNPYYQPPTSSPPSPSA
jgi:hypothetical protein